MFHIYDIKLYSLCHWVYQPWLLSPTEIHNFHHFSQTLPDWLYYGLFASVYFTFTFQVVRSVIQNNCVWCRNICVWCNIIVLEVSCKYHLTWWIMPFVVAAGIDFTNTWDFIRLFSIYASTSLMMESPTIRVSFRGITFNAFINHFTRWLIFADRSLYCPWQCGIVSDVFLWWCFIYFVKCDAISCCI